MFRDRYVTFWVLLAEKLQSSEDQYVASKEGISMLKIITDQLISLSRYYNLDTSSYFIVSYPSTILHLSMAVVNVRDAVTEASLIVGQRAVACCVGLRAR